MQCIHSTPLPLTSIPCLLSAHLAILPLTVYIMRTVEIFGDPTSRIRTASLSAGIEHPQDASRWAPPAAANPYQVVSLRMAFGWPCYKQQQLTQCSKIRKREVGSLIQLAKQKHRIVKSHLESNHCARALHAQWYPKASVSKESN
jgi:hypothetical protein